MSKLSKKLFRDLKNNKSQFINIFIMVFLGVFVFSGIHSYMDGMDISAKNYYENNNLEDIWISGENFTEEDLEQVKKLDNVKDAERQVSIITELEGFEDVTLETIFIESNNISKFFVEDGGESFDRNKDGVWIDSFLAKNLGLSVGDEITFKYQTNKITKKILGLIYTPDHVYFMKDDTAIFPTHKDYGFVYLSIDQFPNEYIYDMLKENIVDESSTLTTLYNFSDEFWPAATKAIDVKDYIIFTTMIVDVKDVEKIEDTKRDIENNLESAMAVTDREASVSYEGYNSEIEEGDTYSGVFTFLFLFIALLSVVTTMNRFVKSERTQIGTLKALGYKRRKIIFHYVSYGFFISLIASFLGIIVGAVILGRFFLNMEMTYFEIPIYSTYILPIVYILAIIVVILVTIVTYLSCRKILMESAVDALRVEVPKVKLSKFNITNLWIFKNSSISTKWNLRDVFRNKGRSLMAIVGVIGCTMLIVCAFGMLDSMNSYLDWEFEVISNFKYKLVLKNDYKDKTLDELKEKYGDSTSKTVGIEIKNGDKKEANSITVNDSKGYLQVTGHNREIISLNNDGIYITEKLANKLVLGIGDSISWHVFGDDDWYDTKISGLNRDPQSQSLTMTREYYESLGFKYKPDSIYTNLDMSNIESIAGVESIQSIENLKEGMLAMLNTMKSMIVIFVVVSAILGFVIIYNLGILSFIEKEYQFATLKVLGFKDKQIRDIFEKQNIWLSIIASFIGLPLGFIMTDYIFRMALGENYDFNAKIKVVTYIIAFFGSMLVSLFVNKVLSKKINKIDMVTSLKGNE